MHYGGQDITHASVSCGNFTCGGVNRAARFACIALLSSSASALCRLKLSARVEEESAEHRAALVAANKKAAELDSGRPYSIEISESYQDAPDTSATGEIMRDLAKNCCCDRFR